jgi:toxin FitB
MNLVDSSGWLEFFANGSHASFFEKPILNTAQLVVPTVSLYEVFKKLLISHNESIALRAVAQMKQGQIIDLDEVIALQAARISHQHKLPMADAFIYSTAQSAQAILWTQDEHFRGLQNVQFLAKKTPWLEGSE